MKSALMLTAVVALLGCGPAATNVPVKGTETSVLLLAGHWVGTYEGTDSGRKGVIHFDLSQGSTYAEGSVTMNADDPTKAAKLPIKFVEAAEKGMVKGSIGPYMDPGLKVQVETEFIGKRIHDTIEGTFTTRPVGSADKGQSGKWKITKTH